MNGSDWLARADLQSLHVDERGRTLTAAFATVASPDDAAADSVHDAEEFFVVFSEVADLVIRGWSHEAAHTCSMVAGQDGRHSVRIEGGGTVVTFTCGDSAVEPESAVHSI
jgi:hypothetical protein